MGPLTLTSLTQPYGSRVAGPPSSGTAYAHRRVSELCPVALTASTRPSAVQPRTEVEPPPQCVSRSPSPPSISAANTSAAPSLVPVHAMRAPSGENLGYDTETRSAVKRQALPPVSGASQTSSSATKVTRSPCRCGYLRYAPFVTAAH